MSTHMHPGTAALCRCGISPESLASEFSIYREAIHPAQEPDLWTAQERESFNGQGYITTAESARIVRTVAALIEALKKEHARAEELADQDGSQPEGDCAICALLARLK